METQTQYKIGTIIFLEPLHNSRPAPAPVLVQSIQPTVAPLPFVFDDYTTPPCTPSRRPITGAPSVVLAKTTQVAQPLNRQELIVFGAMVAPVALAFLYWVSIL